MFQIAASKLGLKAGQTMVDIGATPDAERLDSNCMIPWFRDLGMRVALASPEDITNLATVFPFARILSAKGFHHSIDAGEREFDLSLAAKGNAQGTLENGRAALLGPRGKSQSPEFGAAKGTCQGCARKRV